MEGAAQGTVAERIKQARLERDLSQGELARLLGTSNREIVRWEGGHTLPGYKYRRLLATTFNRHPSYFNGSAR